MKSVLQYNEDLQLAIEFVNHGARLQMFDDIDISRERLIKLYKEIKNESPSKGMLPFSTDWFLCWSHNIHSSVFMNIYNFLKKETELEGPHLLIKAYKLYSEQMSDQPESFNENGELILSLTRAWTLLRFIQKSKELVMMKCTCCSGSYVAHKYDLNKDYTCSICDIPSRAGKTKSKKESQLKMVSHQDLQLAVA